jgi:putative FmdB family regulatory protein
MPLYEYECGSCAHRFERIQKYSDPLVDVCPKCGGTVRKLLSSPAFQFKGSGFYITDYPKQEKGAGSADSSSAKAEGGDKKGDNKSEGSDKSQKAEKSERSEKSEKSSKSSDSSESKPAATPPKGNSEC